MPSTKLRFDISASDEHKLVDYLSAIHSCSTSSRDNVCIISFIIHILKPYYVKCAAYHLKCYWYVPWLMGK